MYCALCHITLSSNQCTTPLYYGGYLGIGKQWFLLFAHSSSPKVCTNSKTFITNLQHFHFSQEHVTVAECNSKKDISSILAAIWWYDDMMIWWYGDMMIWRYDDMVIWRYDDMVIWWPESLSLQTEIIRGFHVLGFHVLGFHGSSHTMLIGLQGSLAFIITHSFCWVFMCWALYLVYDLSNRMVPCDEISPAQRSLCQNLQDLLHKRSTLKLPLHQTPDFWSLWLLGLFTLPSSILATKTFSLQSALGAFCPAAVLDGVISSNLERSHLNNTEEDPAACAAASKPQ